MENILSCKLWTAILYLKILRIAWVHTGICSYPELNKYSSVKFYETGEDEFGILTHWVA